MNYEIDIKNYIEAGVEELNGKLYPVLTTDLEMSVVYNFSPISGGHLKQSQLELIVIGKDYDACKEIEHKLLELLDMEEDVPFQRRGNTRFHSSVSGGGVLFNDGCQMWEDTLYFILDWRNISER